LHYCFLYLATHAQDALVASGSNASGSGGSANYSVGQTVQNTNTGTGGSVIQGIQFYFASSTLTVVDVDTNLNIFTYPNPTSSTLNLKIQGNQNSKLSYKLFNLLGALITKGNITNNTAKINIAHLDMATYLLQVSNSSNNNIKTFKIIKN
jgi:hypothetical protein